VLPKGFKPQKREHFGNTCIQLFAFITFIYYKYHKTRPNHDTKTVKSVAGSIKTEPKRTKMVNSYTDNRNFRASGKKRYQTIQLSDSGLNETNKKTLTNELK